jgi:hypothetical protein
MFCSPVILASDGRIGFYAKGDILNVPNVKTFAEFLEYAHNNKVDIIVMGKEQLHDEGRFGDLTRDFFAHPNHPDLQLLFVYPSENQQQNQRKSSVFYVYRLVGERKQPER